MDSTYSRHQISVELTETALGKAYHGKALYAAMDIDGMTYDDIWLLRRYLDGSQEATDMYDLQELAIWIDDGVSWSCWLCSYGYRGNNT